MTRVSLLGVPFDALTLRETVEAVVETIRNGERGHIATVNVAILMMLRSDPMLARFVRESRIVVADGQPLVWSSLLQGTPLPERVTGVDLVTELSQRAAAEGYRVYLLGAAREVVDELARRLKARSPSLQIAGVDDGYFPWEQAPARAQAIAASGAQILFVGMGVPRQERFLQDYWGQLGINVAIGVGGSFDVLAGLRSRAPRWVQAIGMEWFYRLAQEPRRLFLRYLITNSKFIYLMSKSLIFGTRKHNGASLTS
jgi:N-acetylglucosaminyldiphosphoundecaprenol N-acetyl-beta-D-mannosaminyltransferase